MAKIKISVAQALLILIDNSRSPKEQQKLKKLFLVGANDPVHEKEINQYLQSPILDEYYVSRSITTIDKCPVRRFFETKLAHHVLENTCEKLDFAFLTKLYNNIFDSLPEYAKIYVSQTIAGDASEIFDANHATYAQYAKAFRRIREGIEFSELNAENRQLRATLVMISLVSVAAALTMGPQLPFSDVYGQGYFSSEHRGKMVLDERDAPSASMHLGIMRTSMPVPSFEAGMYTTAVYDATRAADQAHIDGEHCAWIADNFKQLVHPFSNSISGTILCLLKQIKRIFDSGDPLFSNPNEVKHLLQGIICVRLQGVGGHTLHEYTSPLTLHVIQEAMSGVPFIETYRDECNLFLGKDDMYAFDKSLDASIEYNCNIMQRAQVRHELVLSSSTFFARTAQPRSAMDERTRALRQILTFISQLLSFRVQHANTTAVDMVFYYAQQLLHYIQTNDRVLNIQQELGPILRSAIKQAHAEDSKQLEFLSSLSPSPEDPSHDHADELVIAPM